MIAGLTDGTTYTFTVTAADSLARAAPSPSNTVTLVDNQPPTTVASPE